MKSLFNRIIATVYREAESCHHCGRKPSLMGGQYATEFRAFCWECWRREIQHKPDIMQAQSDFKWPFL